LEDETTKLLPFFEIEEEADTASSWRFLCKKLLLTTGLSSLMLADDAPDSIKVRAIPKYMVFEEFKEVSKSIVFRDQSGV